LGCERTNHRELVSFRWARLAALAGRLLHPVKLAQRDVELRLQLGDPLKLDLGVRAELADGFPQVRECLRRDARLFARATFAALLARPDAAGTFTRCCGIGRSGCQIAGDKKARSTRRSHALAPQAAPILPIFAVVGPLQRRIDERGRGAVVLLGSFECAAFATFGGVNRSRRARHSVREVGRFSGDLVTLKESLKR
jgi:hypothetical protein